MIQLTDREKDIIKENKEYLRRNDIKGFYRELNSYAIIGPEGIGHVSQFLIENGIDVFNYIDTIPSNMFYGTDIKSMSIPDGIIRIQSNAFSNCTKLQEVNLGNTVKIIDKEAFSGCGKLSQLFLPDSVSVLGSKVFDNCNPNLVIVANKRTGANRLRCKQGEIPWYKEHLFLNQQDTGDIDDSEEGIE